MRQRNTLRNLPTNYAEAVKRLDGKPFRYVANHTSLEMRSHPVDGPYIAMRYYASDIVTFWPNGDVTLDDCGYCTVSTYARLKVVANANGYAVSRAGGIGHVFKVGDWKNGHQLPDTIPFGSFYGSAVR